MKKSIDLDMQKIRVIQTERLEPIDLNMQYNKQNPLTVIELFAGYGSQHIALERLKRDYPDFDYKVLAISEIEPTALKAYEAIHGECPNLGDVSKIDWGGHPELKNVGLVCYSFPCQDISNAGKQQGFAKGSGTRSGLLWECEKFFLPLADRSAIQTAIPYLISAHRKLGKKKSDDALSFWMKSKSLEVSIDRLKKLIECSVPIYDNR